MTVAKWIGGVACIAAMACTALVMGVGDASAGLFGCRYGNAEQSFARWGDSADYVPIPGGNFESYYSGWSLSGGARIVGGNEPFYIRSTGDDRSLLLPPGSSALSPAVCLQVLTPTIRFVGSSSDSSAVRVTLYTRTLFGLLQIPTYGSMGVSSTWDASDVQPFLLQNVLGLLNLSGVNVYFRFTPVGDSTVQMDDVELDPFFMR